MLICSVWLSKGVFLCGDEANLVKNIANEPCPGNSREQQCLGQVCSQREEQRALNIEIMSKEVGDDFECQAMSKIYPLSSYRNRLNSLNVCTK